MVVIVRECRDVFLGLLALLFGHGLFLIPDAPLKCGRQDHAVATASQIHQHAVCDIHVHQMAQRWGDGLGRGGLLSGHGWNGPSTWIYDVGGLNPNIGNGNDASLPGS
jgi:hypothetical protein